MSHAFYEVVREALFTLAFLTDGTYNADPRYGQALTRPRASASSCAQWSSPAAPMQHYHRPLVLSFQQRRGIPQHVRSSRFRAGNTCRRVAGAALPRTGRILLRHQTKRRSYRRVAARADGGESVQDSRGGRIRGPRLFPRRRDGRICLRSSPTHANPDGTAPLGGPRSWRAPPLSRSALFQRPNGAVSGHGSIRQQTETRAIRMLPGQLAIVGALIAISMPNA